MGRFLACMILLPRHVPHIDWAGIPHFCLTRTALSKVLLHIAENSINSRLSCRGCQFSHDVCGMILYFARMSPSPELNLSSSS